MTDEVKNNNLNNSNEIWITGFSTDDAIKFQEELLEKVEENRNKPIIVNISSPGGDVDGLTMMLDFMDVARSMANPETFGIITVASGRAMSAGAILLSHGDLRLATPNSRLMVHQILGGTWGSIQDINIESAEINRLNHNLLTILYRNCKFKGSMKSFIALLERDKYLTPQEAKDLGLIDLIGYPKVMEYKIYDVLVANGDDPKEELVKRNGKTRRTNKNSSKKKV